MSKPRWECGDCARRSLEKSRHCALMGYPAGETPVWAKEGAIYFQCPESVIGGESAYWIALEPWFRLNPNIPWLDMPAVDCDALQALWRQKENSIGNQR